MLLQRALSVAGSNGRSWPLVGSASASRSRHAASLVVRNAAGPLKSNRHRLFARGRISASSPVSINSGGKPLLCRRPFVVGAAVAASTCGSLSVYWYFVGHCTEREPELPAIPEPDSFVHPYEQWPWHHRAWFVVKRSVFLAWVFAPFMWASTAVLLFSDSTRVREAWLEQMLRCLERAGAAFQKFGQWLSMRPDMFPPDVIEALSKLRSDAPSHPLEVSREMLRDQLGHDIEELFDRFEDEPVASGSVGQVHRAQLRPEFALDGPGGRLRDVAVKVQHPGVVESAFMDLSIVWKVVEFSERFLHMTLPFNRGEFDEVIRAQMDFTREAFNLQRFSQNFRGEPRIRFPQVSATFAKKQVLIETWADGKVISNILEDFDHAKESASKAVYALNDRKREMQTRVCSILYDMGMKMMLRDNFVHGDLHGGNILYSEGDNHVTVLDAGVATSLDKQTFAPFGNFLHALCSGNTEGTVEYLQQFNQSRVKVNTAELRRDIQVTMDRHMGSLRENPDLPLNAADIFAEVFSSMQRHRMLLKGDVASTLFTISISEGLIRQLDPAFDVAKRAIPYIVKHKGATLQIGSCVNATH